MLWVGILFTEDLNTHWHLSWFFLLSRIMEIWNDLFCCWVLFDILKEEKNFCRITEVKCLLFDSKYPALLYSNESTQMKKFQIWKSGRQGVLMVASNSFSIYFDTLVIHTVMLIQNFSLLYNFYLWCQKVQNCPEEGSISFPFPSSQFSV